MGRRFRWVTLVTVVVGLASSGPAAHGVDELPTTTAGYIPMADGTQLHYSVTRPAATGRFPVALVYSPYADGTDPFGLGNDPLTAPQLLGAGYAVLGVNVRGSGCSTGSFGPFDRQEALDGAAVIEWAAAQSWSDGNVGMFGLSAPGILQFGPAGQRPPHLRAIAPFQFITDLYRDVVFPGGLPNQAFPPAWLFGLQPGFSTAAALDSGSQGDTQCTARAAEREAGPWRVNVVGELLGDPFDGGALQNRNPDQYLSAINVPALTCISWQDDDLESRGLEGIDKLNPATTWVIGTNGYHGICDDPQFGDRLVAFFDRFVRGADNGFDTTPHVILAHESHVATGGPMLPLSGWILTDVNPPAFSAPGWTTTFPSWPIAVEPTTFSFASAGPRHYEYPVTSTGSEDSGTAGNPNVEWKVPPAPVGSVAFTTAALDHDAEFFGPGSINLSLASTATDTDVQVTLSEVRPDGNEVYIQRGWLRASHRALDIAKSTALRPYQTHRATDAQPLVPGHATPMRIELFPFDCVFRAGSLIRLTIDAPTANTGLFAFDYIKTPAINTISNVELVLGRIPGASAQTRYPPCDTVINQPCRPNRAPVPATTTTTTTMAAQRPL